MDTKKLRQKVLDLAIRGKLVPQDPNDEPASVLLERIREEKERLIKEGKIKRDKKEKTSDKIPYEKVPFELPKGWVWCKLEEVSFKIFDGPFGSHLKTADYTVNGVRVIRLENLGEMKFIEQKETFISEEKYRTIEKHTVYEGDIIIGSFLADGVKCVVLPEIKQIAIAKADCFTIRIDQSLLSNKYLMYLLSSYPMYLQLSQFLKGMTRARINATQLKTILIPLPPLAEQHRIISKIEKIFTQLDEIENSIKA